MSDINIVLRLSLVGTPSVLTEDGVFNTATYIFGRQKIPVWRKVPSYCYLSEFLYVIFKETFNMVSEHCIQIQNSCTNEVNYDGVFAAHPSSCTR